MRVCGLVIPDAVPPSLGCNKEAAEARDCTLCTVLAALSPAEIVIPDILSSIRIGKQLVREVVWGIFDPLCVVSMSGCDE